MTQAALDLSVVVPCFESGAELDDLVARLDAMLAAQGGASEVILANDGFQAATWDRIQSLATRYARVWGLCLEARVGQHRATLAGIDQSLGEIAVTLDDDLEHRPEDVPLLLAALRSRPDVDCAVAAFPAQSRARYRRAASAVMDRAYRARYGGDAPLEMTPFRALRRGLARRLLAAAPSHPNLTRLLLESGARIINVPVTHQSSRRPSRYGAGDLVAFAWRSLGLPSPAGRSSAPAPVYRVRARTGRDATEPAGAESWPR